MPEYIVDCDELPLDNGRFLVLPVSVNGHVHEAIVRCRDCEYAKELDHKGAMLTICYHRASLAHTTMPDGFCHNGKPRSDHGKPS